MRPPPAGGPHGNDGLFRRIWYAHAGPEPGILCTEMKRETGSSVIGGLLKHTAGLSPGSGRGDSETARSACGRPDCPRVTSLVACSSGANRNVEPTARLGPGQVRSTAGQSPPRPQWCAPRAPDGGAPPANSTRLCAIGRHRTAWVVGQIVLQRDRPALEPPRWYP